MKNHPTVREKVAGALSWRPWRRGRIYCSPACGGDCRLAEFERVTASAKRLAARLTKWYADGDPVKAYMIRAMPKSKALRAWVPVVHENLGWHWHVKSPCQQLRVFRAGRRETPYSAWFEPPGLGQFIADASTPEKAIEAALDMARKWSKDLADALALATRGRTW